MQNKGFIRVFAVLLTLVCLFYISFSFVTRHYTKKAEEYANGDAMKYKQYIDSIATEKVYLGYYTFKQCREMEIGLGLDLKGGMNVTLQISVADVLRSLSNNNTDVNFNKALANATANQADNKDFLSAFVNEYKKLDPNIRLAARWRDDGVPPARGDCRDADGHGRCGHHGQVQYLLSVLYRHPHWNRHCAVLQPRVSPVLWRYRGF